MVQPVVIPVNRHYSKCPLPLFCLLVEQAIPFDREFVSRVKPSSLSEKSIAITGLAAAAGLEDRTRK